MGFRVRWSRRAAVIAVTAGIFVASGAISIAALVGRPAPYSGRAVILSSHMLAEVEQTCIHVVPMHVVRPIAAGPVSEIIGGGGALLIGTPRTADAIRALMIALAFRRFRSKDNVS